MIAKPVAAFGHVVFLTTLADGEQISVDIKSDNGAYTNGYYFYYEGLAKFCVVETGINLPDRSVGWLNKEHNNAGTDKPGTVAITALGQTSWVCMPLTHNVSLPLNLSSIMLSDNESGIFSKGSDLFLVTGEVIVGGRSFIGPSQIRIRSGDLPYIASKASSILRFA
jgi:hypothetical protein